VDQFIQVYKKVFNDEFCNKAIDAFNNSEANNMVMYNRQDHDKVTKIERQDSSIYIPRSYTIEYDCRHLDQQIANEFNNIFWNKCYKEYSDKFDILKHFNKHTIYSMKLQKTKPGQGFHTWHAETADRESTPRLLTWTVYLNDEFEAGETEFLYQQYRYKPQKGDCIIFPAAYTHTHRGNPPIGGDKYIITGWVEF
jgi:hypothetical protein